MLKNFFCNTTNQVYLENFGLFDTSNEAARLKTTFQIWWWILESFFMLCSLFHNVWKSLKKSHSTLRAKRAMLTIEWPKMPKLVKIWSLQSNTRHVSFKRKKLVENAKIEVCIKMRHSDIFFKHYVFQRKNKSCVASRPWMRAQLFWAKEPNHFD